MTARRIAIVPHTHWDREWYKSYQDFRLALVELIDTLLPLLERDSRHQRALKVAAGLQAAQRAAGAMAPRHPQ